MAGVVRVLGELGKDKNNVDPIKEARRTMDWLTIKKKYGGCGGVRYLLDLFHSLKEKK